MNLLPWLLDWPPSRATVGVFVVVTAFSIGTLVLFGGITADISSGNVSIESVDISVRLNDAAEIPGTGGSVKTCLGSGTPGDSILLNGDVTVDIPVSGDTERTEEQVRSLVVSLAHTNDETVENLRGTGQVTQDVFWILDDDETLSPGGTASIQVRVRTGEKVVAETTQIVTVENGSRSYDC